ncbi:MAG: hypothetical protein QM731_08555 [Chitinophagaceae bacterium]
MKKYIVVAVLFISFTAFTIAIDKGNDEQIRASVNKSLLLLQSNTHVFLQNAKTCHSCHSNSHSAITFELAKQKGFAVDGNILKENIDSIISTPIFDGYDLVQMKRDAVENNDFGPGNNPAAIANGYDLWALSVNHYTLPKALQLQLINLMRRQTVEGCWTDPNPRPPLEYYSFTATALILKAMQAYSLPVYSTEIAERKRLAQTWLTHTAAKTNEEKVFQLLGLTWIDGDKKIIQQQAAELLKEQREDGGWSQLYSLTSDAYATGQSLYALYTCGQLKTDDAVYKKGIDFLLKTQYGDGSWNVQTRTYPLVPFVESGFPHGDNQFISASGTNWATMALLLAVK